MVADCSRPGRLPIWSSPLWCYTCSLRCRPADATPTPSESNHAASVRRAKRWILLGEIVLPVVVLAPLFLTSIRTLSALMHDTRSDLTIHVTGRQWWWQVRYKGADGASDVLAANEIHIPAGRRIRIELATPDVIHSLWIPNLHGKTLSCPDARRHVDRGRPSRHVARSAPSTADCSTRAMALPVIAEEQAAFDAWLARERLPAPAAQLDSAARRRIAESLAPAFLRTSPRMRVRWRGSPLRFAVGQTRRSPRHYYHPTLLPIVVDGGAARLSFCDQPGAPQMSGSLESPRFQRTNALAKRARLDASNTADCPRDGHLQQTGMVYRNSSDPG